MVVCFALERAVSKLQQDHASFGALPAHYNLQHVCQHRAAAVFSKTSIEVRSSWRGLIKGLSIILNMYLLEQLKPV